ncbi:membrane hypothetical protein [Vibrio coralliirubri]|uniref:EpsG family protein n=1 Tax=Vibrio coralliirubri TaxID=1516159 RepID=UPI0006372A04|nr:EpsG family protein [Vibrio coralliirubri]CDT40024.1 membrane hypothetical protein [Vibrio coralliirubri]
MIDYIFIFILCIFFSLIMQVVNHRFYRISILFIVALVLALFSGLRYYVGWDFEIYQSLYDMVYLSSNPIDIINHINYRDFEIGFRVFSLSAAIAPYLPVLLSCLVSVGISFLIIHKAPSKIFGVFIFMYLWYEYFAVFNIQRQVIAHAILLLGLYFTLTYNRKFFIVASVPLAFTFHVSSLIIFVFYFSAFVSSKRFGKIDIKLGFLLVMVSFLLLVSPFNVGTIVFKTTAFILGYLGGIGQHASIKISYYFEYLNLYKVGISFRYLEYVLVFLVAVYKSEHILSKVKGVYGKRLFLVALYMCAIHIFSYAFFSGLGVIQDRIESYFFLMHTVLISYLALIINNKIKSHVLIVLLCSLFVSVKYSRLLGSEAYIGADSHYQRFVPYNNIFASF